jgi:hypothetical protein
MHVFYQIELNIWFLSLCIFLVCAGQLFHVTIEQYLCLQHKGLPYCEVPCYLALFGPRGYRQGVSSFETRSSPTENTVFDNFVIIPESDLELVSRHLLSVTAPQFENESLISLCAYTLL